MPTIDRNLHNVVDIENPGTGGTNLQGKAGVRPESEAVTGREESFSSADDSEGEVDDMVERANAYAEKAVKSSTLLMAEDSESDLPATIETSGTTTSKIVPTRKMGKLSKNGEVNRDVSRFLLRRKDSGKDLRQ